MLRLPVPIAAVVVVLALSGCGEKRETTTGAGTSGASSSPGATVSETEFKLDPAAATVDKAGQVTVEVKNDGSTEHALEIDAPGGEVKTPALAPGKSATLKLDLKAGSYQMYCPIDGHKDKGMKGELVVAGGGTDDNGGSSNGGGGGRDYGY
jgi:uncharacterized cupredoxin-like copper-binding protein